MNCPHCTTEVLLAIEYDQVEIDYCAVCGGIWLDSGEIELLFGDAAAAQDFLSIGSHAEVPAREKPRICPECDVTMTKEATESAPPVIFDHCPNGDGLWFDRGELHSVLKHSDAFGDRPEVWSLLKNIFSSTE